MLKSSRSIFHVILIVVFASLTLVPVSQAAYDYNKKVTVDHTRVGGTNAAPPAGYGFVKQITIDNTQVSGTSDLSNFPVLVSIKNDATIKTLANGGRVTDAQGDDLVFFASDLSTRLDYEVEHYDGAAGTLIAWVRLPVLDHDADTVFYLAYGNNTINDSLEDVPGVWDSDFKGVWHMQEEAAGTGNTDLYQDSTANANHGDDEVSDTGQSGKIGGGQGFDGSNDYLNFGSDPSLNITNAITMSAWVDLAAHPGKDKWMNLLIKGDAPYNMYIQGIKNDETTLGAYFEIDGKGKDLWDLTSIKIDPAAGWAHVAVTFDGTDIKFYVNGVLDHTENEPGTIDDSTGLDLVFANNESEWFYGSVDEIRLSSTARSTGWIATEYNNQNNPGGFMTIADSAPLADFPVLVSIQNDPQLKTTANGGQVTDAQGDDIIFTADAGGLSQLDHEVESYDPATGSLVAWVRLPLLPVSEDTIFYMQYGNSDVSTSQEKMTDVWDSNYLRVWHLEEQVSDEQTSGTHIDSTGTANGTQNRNGPIAGRVAGAQDFDGNVDSIDVGLVSGIANAFTVSAWVKHNNLPAAIEKYLNLSDEISTRHDGVNSVGQLHFYMTVDGDNYRHLRINDALTIDTWYHVVGTWDGMTQRVYLIGLEKGAQQPGGTLDPVDGGGTISSPTEAINGIIDEVRISTAARSADWITTTYNNQQWPNKAQHPAEGFVTVERSTCDTGATVACDGTPEAGSIETPGGWDAFKLTLGSDTWLEVYTTGDTDTYGHLYDANCNEIAQDDTSDDNFHISQAAAAGTYYVQVRHASASGTGAYELYAECAADDHGDSMDEATALECGSSIGGSIDTAGDEDYFKVVFWGTGILTAYTSGGSDPDGTLLDDGGSAVAFNADGGDGNNFKIEKSVGPGTYYVVVREKDPADTGTYTLHVTCEYTPVITATAESGGTICTAGSDPCESGAVGVAYGTDQTFTITPDPGNTIRDVWVDGEWVGAVSSREFKNVTADHKIVAVFNADFENYVDIPDIPLDAWYRSAPANVMFLLDDSGSMDWEFMTTDGNGLFENYYYYVFDNPGDNVYSSRILPDNRRNRWKSQWAGYNKMYYDPAVTYSPWPNHDPDDPDETLDPAHTDTPRSHPMHDDKTFNLNTTYYEYTTDSSAIVVNDQDSGFSKTPDGAGDSGFSADFEDNNWDAGFEDNGETDWKKDNKEANPDTGSEQSAKATKNEGGTLTSDDIDAGDLTAGDSTSVEFYFLKEKLDDDELTLYYYNGSSYDLIEELDPLVDDEEWMHRQLKVTDSKYFISNFRIRFDATISEKKGKARVDDVVVTPSGDTAVWNLATGSDQAEQGDYWWTAADGDYTATWTADIPSDGEYDIYARWHADDNHSTEVTYTVSHDDGPTDVDVNQRQNGGKWMQLGTFEYDEDDVATVTLSHRREGNDDRACADAIKIVPAGAVDAVDIIQAHYYTWSESADKPYLVVLDGKIDYYAVNDAVVHGGNGDNRIDAGELAKTGSPPADVEAGGNYANERQNFANWYQFYRRRELTATAAIAQVIAGLKGVQVGFYSINGNLVQPAVPVQSNGVDKSKKLLESLYKLKLRAQGTPLRRGLREVGNYFASSSAMLGSSPYATAENGGACQQAFTIVMTDGFWNGSTPSIGNSDGDDNTDYDGGGYADVYSSTLADVAMKYYETDLHTGLDDNVPTSDLDGASHQHMVTYAVSFGRVGSLDPADYDTANGEYPAWPDPRYINEHKIDDLWHAAVNGRGEFLNASSPTELVDSLLAISRSIQGRITSSSSVSVNGDPMYEELDDNTRMYQATYRSDGWVGDVKAYQIDTGDGDVAASPVWSAADRLAATDWDSGRVIATYDGTDGIPFRYNPTVLSTAQQIALGSDLSPNSPDENNAVKILNYLRGDRSDEEQNGGAFSDRFQVLGDIVHSSPVYHQGVLYAGGNDGMLHAIEAASGDELFAYVPDLVFDHLSALVDPDYSHKYYVDLSPVILDVTLSGQPKSILVGGLGKGGKGYYALDVTNATGISNEDDLADRVLWEFPDPNAEYQGYLAYDSRIAAIAVGDDVYTLGKKAVGKVVAIPVADPDEGTGILSLTFAPGKGMFNDGEDLFVTGDVKVAEVDGRLYDPDMGYSYSQPVIARSNAAGAEWIVIFGNGYNSSKSHAVLYVVNLATGELIKRIDTGVGNCNGLSSPVAIDVDFNGTADYVYAGDLKGHLWKFELHDADTEKWGAAYEDTGGNPASVFQAKNFSVPPRPQPITSKPDVMYHCSKEGYMVIFGTGRYLTELDLESTESNSIYGIWDYGDDDDNREYLGSFERADTPQLVNPHLVDVTSRDRVELLEQALESGSYSLEDGRTARVFTDHSPVWGTVIDSDIGQSNPDPDPGSLIPGETVHAGWYFDLPNTGEMVVSDVIIRDGIVWVISFTPGDDPCGSGGTSVLHALDACSGGHTGRDVFGDINELLYQPLVGDETKIKINPSGIEFSGRIQPPVILRKGGKEYFYLSSSSGKVYKQEVVGVKLGIFYWMQLD